MSSDTFVAVTRNQLERGLITRDHKPPIISVPLCSRPSPLQSDLTVYRHKNSSDTMMEGPTVPEKKSFSPEILVRTDLPVPVYPLSSWGGRTGARGLYKLDLTRFLGYEFRSTSAKDAFTHTPRAFILSVPRARNEPKSALRPSTNYRWTQLSSVKFWSHLPSRLS
ncbi:hypothetical protein TNCV_572321 [Trichonephila clavipes]|nr:hypothetical protein TNCV_572321 [Trichonephila clavipes]